MKRKRLGNLGNSNDKTNHTTSRLERTIFDNKCCNLLLIFFKFFLLCYFSSYCCLISNVNTLRSSVRHTDNRLMEIWREKNGAIQWKILIICLQIYTHFRRGVCVCVCVRLHFIPMLLLVGYAVEAYWSWSESRIPRMIVHKKRHKTIPYRLQLHMGWMHWSSLLEYCSTVYPLSELNAIFLNLTS